MFISKEAEDYFAKQVLNKKTIQIKLKNSGCSGYAYVLDVVDRKPLDIKIKTIYFEVAEIDKPALNNVLVNLKKDGLNTRIVFENPQAYNECGCGESFSIRK